MPPGRSNSGRKGTSSVQTPSPKDATRKPKDRVNADWCERSACSASTVTGLSDVMDARALRVEPAGHGSAAGGDTLVPALGRRPVVGPPHRDAGLDGANERAEVAADALG